MRQRYGSPLGHSLAGGGGSVAVGGKIGDVLPVSPHILIKNIVHNPADGIVDRASVHKTLVVGRAVCDVKTVAPPPVPFRKNAIQGKGDNGVDIRRQCGLGPCGIYLAAGRIFHIIREGYLYIGCGGGGRPQMHGDGIGDGYLAQKIRIA